MVWYFWGHFIDISKWFQEKFEDTKGVIRIRKSKKDKQYHGQEKNGHTKWIVEFHFLPWAIYMDGILLQDVITWIVFCVACFLNGDWFMQRGQTPMFARETIYTPYFYLQKRNHVGSINEFSSKTRPSLIDRMTKHKN
jgi:hypothetical protein